MSVSRRQLLIVLSSIAPAALLITPSSLSAQTKAEPSVFLRISQIITSNQQLEEGIAEHIHKALVERIPDFDRQLKNLADKFNLSSISLDDRETILSHLTENETKLALEIAKPWYLGFVGDPKGNVLNDDDAQFMTYLQAQAYELVIKDLPRPGYPPDARGWWEKVPYGVVAPSMPETIIYWNVQQAGADGRIEPADEKWRAYALGQTDVKPV